MNFELTAFDPDFPMALRETHPPVSMVFGLGSSTALLALGSQPGLAIVGSRQATPQGLADAHWFAREVGQAGLTIVSGLALGIDASAHRGALAGGGTTIAVLGHGRDSIYPAQHRPLASEILGQGGALITEYPDGTPARPFHFPSRNRIIAGLSRAVLVVEAAPQSGSLSTARHALDLGVDVFVVPGSIHQAQSLGSNRLIRDGAQLVQSPQQLLEDLGLTRKPSPSTEKAAQTSCEAESCFAAPTRSVPDGTALDPESKRVLAALDYQAASVADLQKACRVAEDRLYGCLMILELSGLVNRTPDGRWLKYKVL